MKTAAEIRARILDVVAANGGHLASSLGAVELCRTLATVFDPLKDRIVWDVGHQAYAWKILTGRDDRFGTLRKRNGISGFPDPGESAADAFVAGHAGVALGAAEGLAAARDLTGGNHHVVAVVGDASLTNGMTLEALNNCTSLTEKVILVVNDNEMSIARNTGAFARHLGRLISGVRYNRVKAAAERAGHKLRLTFLRDMYHHVETVVKSFWLGNAFFESFGMRYIGPVDGHDERALTEALTVAKEDKRSVVVHVVTVKGRGFAPAENHPTKWHGPGPFSPEAALRGEMPETKGATWSDAFGAALLRAAAQDGRVCALTAAMRDGTGLAAFAQAYPKRFFDVGICEGNLVTFAAGLAKGGQLPVVAVYSTFLQRAIDQVIHDVALQQLPVVFAVDRAGAVGADGKTHQGIFDIALLRAVPGLTICQPTTAAELDALLAAALKRKGPTVIRYPRGKAAEEIRGADDGKRAGGVHLVALGDQVAKARDVQARLAEKGIEADVTAARYVKPVEEAVRAVCAGGGLVASLENGTVAGGFGEAIGATLKFGWPDRFLPHGTVAELERDFGFDAAAIAARIVEKLNGEKKEK